MVIEPGHPLFHHLETILQKVPAELKDRMNVRQLPEDTPADIPSEKALTKLHRQVRFFIARYVNNSVKHEKNILTHYKSIR